MKVDILVPTSLQEINLEQYQKYERLNTKENQNSAFLLHKLVEIFCNLELKNVAKIKYSYVKDIAEDLDKLFSEDIPLVKTFILDNKKFGFIPVLDEMSFGEYIDLDSTISDWEQMHKALAVLYRPIIEESGDRYKIEDYEGDKYADIMKKAPLDVVFGSLVFFYNLGMELFQITLNYLQKELMQEMTIPQRQILEENGVSINQFTHSLKEMLPNSIRLRL
jgi:hypothetical protein|tara:strand:- start:2050 stop:2712 length:663 start_codon:yes stop_codon:yes gene_type:complete